MTNRIRTLRALLFRDWMLMKTWVFGFVLIMVAGPVINLVNSLGGTRSTKLMSIIESLYNSPAWGYGIDIAHHHMVVVDFRNLPTFFIQGSPTASLWTLAIGICLGAILVTFDRQSTVILDVLNAPIGRRDWLWSKFLFGSLALVSMMILRMLVIGGCDLLSPWRFGLGTVGMSFVINTTLAWVCYSITFLVGILVGNAVLAGGLGFFTLTLPLVLGAVVRFAGESGILPRAFAYHAEHRFFLGLSPFSYTDYLTGGNQRLSGRRVVSMTMTTAVNHPWALAATALVASVIAYLIATWIFDTLRAERLSDAFASMASFRVAAVIVATVFGSVAAQIISRAGLLVWIAAGLFGYVSLSIMYRRFRVRESRVRRPGSSTAS